jgi:O-antigen/teichoic acid export membrane protein
MEKIPEATYQKFAKDVLITGAARVLVALTGLLMLPLFTKFLGVHDYGIWAQVQVTFLLFSAFVGFGLPAAMARFLPAKTDRGEIQEGFYSVFALTLFTSFLFALAMILSADFIADVFFDGATEIVRITGLIILVMSPTLVCLGLFRSLRQMKKVAIFTIATSYGQVAVIAYLILNGYELLSIVYGVLAIKVIGFLIVLFLIKRKIGIRRPHFSRIKEYLSFGLPTVPGAISAWVVSASDRYVIAYFLGATSVGIYSAGYRLGSILLLVTAGLATVLPPTLAKLYDEGQMDKTKTHLSYSLKYFLALAIPFVAGAAMLSEQVLRIFSTPAIASDGYLIVPFVAFGGLLIGTAIIFRQSISLVKKTRIIGVTWIVAGLVNLVLNILLIPHFGILAAAITTVIAYSLASGIFTYYSVKELRFSIDWGFIGKSIIASAIMSLIIWMLGPIETLATIATVVVGVIIYGVTLILLRGFKEEDIAFFKGLFQRGS